MLMNPIFASHIEAVPNLFAVLNEATPFVEKGLVAQRKLAGIYTFFENGIPLHVGRTRNLQQRSEGAICIGLAQWVSNSSRGSPYSRCA
jgi:hypothetical protein